MSVIRYTFVFEYTNIVQHADNDRVCKQPVVNHVRLFKEAYACRLGTGAISIAQQGTKWITPTAAVALYNSSPETHLLTSIKARGTQCGVSVFQEVRNKYIYVGYNAWSCPKAFSIPPSTSTTQLKSSAFNNYINSTWTSKHQRWRPL
jgi:hypothetical protein